MANQNNSINYIEFPLINRNETKRFYGAVFGWNFTDWGPDYISFSGAGVEGGFNGSDDTGVSPPGVLVVLYTDDLGAKLRAVEDAGGTIAKPIYGFPGGSDFTFMTQTALNWQSGQNESLRHQIGCGSRTLPSGVAPMMTSRLSIGVQNWGLISLY